MTLLFILAAAAGGALGSVARYVVGIASGKLSGTDFPWGTLIIDVTGSFLFGAFVGLSASKWRLSQAMRISLTVGICGGYTTFSTFSLDAVVLRPNRLLERILEFVKEEEADVVERRMLLGERLFEQPHEIEGVDKHVGYETEHDRRFRRSFRLQEEHHQYDREDQSLHQDMDRRDELNLLNVIDSEHVPP